MFSSLCRRSVLALATSGALAAGVCALPTTAVAQPQTGLVNVALTGNTVQVPVAVAANICGVQANVIASNNFQGNSLCSSAARSTATGGGGGGGTTPQQGLINVAITNNTVQVPIGVAADVCGVQANVIASGNFTGNTVCSAISTPTA
jgi:hypothetical protein